jgi:sporulation protein YlmC with PRC-barrel domain
MDIPLGTHVHTTDDHDLGTISRVILDPATGDVKTAVVRKDTLLPNEIEVPREALSPGPDGLLRVTCSAEEARDLRRFEKGSYVSPPLDYIAPAGYPVNTVYWPIGMLNAPVTTTPNVPEPSDGGVADEIRAALMREDMENAVIKAGSAVLSRDGKKIGELQQLHFDDASGRLTRLVVHRGLFRAKEIELPAAVVSGVDDGVITLNIDEGDRRLGADKS